MDNLLSHREIVEALDSQESRLFTQYVQLRRLRVRLQKQWNVTPQNRQNDERDKEE